jgi:quercetin dioxygenase-like cupin family protein
MKINLKYLLPVALFVFTACNNNQKADGTKQKAELVFKQGKKVTNNNFTGTVYLQGLIEGDSLNPTSVGNVTFEPGARSKWHLHPAGQILLATAGVGYYQEKGKPKVILHKGDVIKCPPNVSHWHGASVDSVFIQVAITSREKGPTVWLEAVSDSSYLSKGK